MHSNRPVSRKETNETPQRKEEESGDFPVLQVMERRSGSLCPADACTGMRARYFTYMGQREVMVLKLVNGFKIWRNEHAPQPFVFWIVTD